VKGLGIAVREISSDQCGGVLANKPLVSIVMSVYNGSPYLRDSVESVLCQTLADFEFFIVDDGSTDDTWQILTQYTDPRIRLRRNDTRIGLTRALNALLPECCGTYIARMDADDISHPSRLAHQVQFLEQHPSVVVVGTAYVHLDFLRSRTLEIVPPLDNAAIRRALVTSNPLCHSSVMMRRDALLRVGYYDESFRYSQDYELWSRLAQIGELHNLEKVLLTRRYHARSVSNQWATEIKRLRLFRRASKLAIRRLGLPWYNHLASVQSVILFLIVDLWAVGRQVANNLIHRGR
jgi:glycosyltransferase involved in cell wall biosynthesis